MSVLKTPDWFAVDWGTSNLRAYAMQGARMMAHTASTSGMSSLTPDGYHQALEALLAQWDAPDIPVIACGMVGSRQGWVEAPYRTVPCMPLADHLARVPNSGRRAVFVVPGLSQGTPPDVMRGEETQIAGFLALNPGWDGVL
ncbi:MAG: 2-dehydro-3-deoxygalactonokinase, partial [Roseobacter sp.]|nr:2-dehydro-3-deoxygalactonokinase [Roseobacter sp.]